MGQEVKNPLRAQSKYGLMGSSAKTAKKIFEGHRSTLWIKMTFGIGHPPQLYINCSLHVWGRIQGSQIFKQNSIISICSKVMAFLVISLFLWSPTLSPCHPHIVPVIPTSSLSSPHRPHSPQKVPMWSPWLWSPLSPWSPPHVVPVVPTLSPLSPHCPHVIPVSSLSSPCHPHSPQKVPMWFPWLWSLWSPLSPWSPPHVVPVVPTSSSCCPHRPHII